MAEERNLATVRAPEADDVDSTKAELQRRMEEARESITQTVTEIKDTVANQYQSVKETVTEALDWREQYRKRPLAFTIGAMSAGFIVGYSVAGTFKGERQYDEDDDYWSISSEETDLYSRTGAEPAKLSSSPYAQRGLAGGRPESAEESPALRRAAAAAPAPSSYGSTGYEASARVQADYGDPGYDATQEAESGKPGLLERFKETRAYDKLQEEVATLGDRFVEELSNVGQTVVLPMLFGKIKELFGVDLSGKQSKSTGAVAASSSAGTRSGSTASESAQPAGGASGGAASSAGAGAGGTSGGAQSARSSSGTGGSSYATSENRDYPAQSPDRT